MAKRQYQLSYSFILITLTKKHAMHITEHNQLYSTVPLVQHTCILKHYVGHLCSENQGEKWAQLVLLGK